MRGLSALLVPGAQLGPYRVVGPLGAGGLATVVRAQGPDGGFVALKLLHADDDEQLRRAERELEVLRGLEHPNIVRLLDGGEHQGYPWLALELVEGPDLEGLVAQWARTPPPDRLARVLRLVRGLASALDYIHARGIYHRDLKPSNVLVAPDGEARLTDFGAVKAPGAFSTHLTAMGRLVGTVAFMAPEQITGGAIDARTDLYALGALMYLLLTGRRPIVAETVAGYLSKHLMEDPAPPVEVSPEVPVQLSRVCMRLLRKDPALRYASAAELLDALDAAGTLRRKTLHGRGEELAALDEALVRLRQGQAGFVAVVGPPGIGRTALLDELERRALEDGVRVLRFRVGQGLSPSADPSGQELVLADDLDRGTSADAEALATLARQGGARLLVYAVRGDPDPSLDVLRRLQPLAAFTSPEPGLGALALGPLDEAACVAMLRDAGLPGAVAAAVGRRLAPACQGNPAELLEQLVALEEASWLHRDPTGALRLRIPLERLRADPLPLPPARAARVLEGLGRLRATDRGVLHALVVLGGEAEQSLVEALLDGAGLPPEGGPLDEHVERHTESLHQVLRLRKPEVQAVIYAAIPPAQRQLLHRRAAAVLLARHQRRRASVADLAARHLAAGGQAADAWPLLVLSAQRAQRQGEARAALGLADEALAQRALAGGAGGTPALHQQALAARGEALLALQRPAEALPVLEEALDLPVPEPNPLVPQLMARQGMALGDLGRWREALQALEQALREMDPGAPLRFPTLRALAEAQLSAGQVGRARATWEDTLAAARLEGSVAREGSALLGLGELELALGHPEQARATLAQAEKRLRAAEGWRALAICLCSLADLAVRESRWGSAESRAAEALHLCRDKGLGELLSSALVYQAVALEGLGEPARAREACAEALALEMSREDLPARPLALLHALAPRLVGPEAVEGLRPAPR